MSNGISVEESLFGHLSDGQKVKKFTLKNSNGFEVNVISYGASIQAINLKDKNDKLVNVSLGFDKIEEYSDSSLNPYIGASVGRVANRISNGKFSINGVTYNLDKNNGNHCLHGGNSGFSFKNWTSDILDDGVKFAYLSPDGEGGFPGEVWVEAIYRLESSQNNNLLIEYKAITDKSTPIILTNHFYFNLSGHDSGLKIYDHHLKLFADKYLDFNPDEVTVTGKVNPVENTKYDFREYTRLGDRIQNEGKWPEEGYDNFFLLNDNNSEKRNVASVKNPLNGVRLDVWSNQNGVQLYTANFLNVKKPSNGQTHSIHEAFCLETHNYPDSVNHETFPSCILNPDEEYSQKTTLSFSVDK